MKQATRFFVSALLTVVFSLCASAQTLVFHLPGGAKSTVSLPATFTVTPKGDKLVIDGGGSVVELAKDDVMCVTYRGKKCDVNEDATVDVADISTIIDIMAGKGGDDTPAGDVPGTKTFTVNGVSFTMIDVEGGTFQMGSNDGYSDEKPVHQVQLSSFSIGQTEVTQELWEAVMGSNPSSFKGLKLPVETVSWNDCQTFITKLNALTGQQFRLPTEAEWEFAARSGTKSQGYTYSGSNTLGDVAWYTDNSSSKTHEVATKQANELGLYDMSGNVWEWCQDWYGDSYYSSSVINNPTGPTSGSYRVIRGGGWFNTAASCRVALRSGRAPAYADNGLGFRLAL